MIKLAEIPRFLLFAQANLESFRGERLGRWRFALQSLDGPFRFDATDWEPDVTLDRLELLTVIRGLEELDQSSAVTICSASRYLAHGFDFGLREWRQNDWRWEQFGEWVPISNDDLWRRLDRASRYHKLDHRIARSGELPSEVWSTARPDFTVQPRRATILNHGIGRWVRQLSRVASSIIPI
jgi:ribonuclease HI